MKGKKTLKQQNSNQKQLLSQTPRQQPQTTMNTKAEAQRLFWFRAGFTGWTMPKPAAHSEPELCYSLGINPQQQFAASVLLFTLKSVSRKVSGLFRHPSTGKYLPSRGTRNTDVAFVNSALKNGSSSSSFSSVLLYFSSPDSLWWCCSCFFTAATPQPDSCNHFPPNSHCNSSPVLQTCAHTDCSGCLCCPWSLSVGVPLHLQLQTQWNLVS